MKKDTYKSYFFFFLREVSLYFLISQIMLAQLAAFWWSVKETESHILVRLLRLFLCFSLGWGCGGGSRAAATNADGSAKKALTFSASGNV